MLVRDEAEQPHAYLLTQPSTHYFQVMTPSSQEPVFVGEPSVEDTIAILRGLKPRYETHHGVKIKDSALIAAAKLWAR